MNKQEFVNALAEKTGSTAALSRKFVDAYAETVAESMKKGEDIALPGFGTFTTAKRAARTGRNPQTGASIKISASTVPKFRPGKSLKDAAAAKKGKKK